MGAGFDRCVQRVGRLSGFVGKIICWVVCRLVGLCYGRVPAVFELHQSTSCGGQFVSEAVLGCLGGSQCGGGNSIFSGVSC